MSRLGLRLTNYGVPGWDIDIDKNFQILDAYASGRVIMEAGENMAAACPVYVKNDGKVWKASATAGYPALGMTSRSCVAGEDVIIIVRGPITTSGLTSTANYYLSETAGQITSTPPANKQLLGTALSTTVLWLCGNMLTTIVDTAMPVNEARSLHTADTISLIGDTTLTVNQATHGHVADSFQLTGG